MRTMPLTIYVNSFGLLFIGLFVWWFLVYIMFKTTIVIEWFIDVVVDIHKWVSATDARR